MDQQQQGQRDPPPRRALEAFRRTGHGRISRVAAAVIGGSADRAGRTGEGPPRAGRSASP